MTTRYAHSPADDKMAAVRRLDFAAVRWFLIHTGRKTDFEGIWKKI